MKIVSLAFLVHLFILGHLHRPVRSQQDTDLQLQSGQFQRLLIFVEDRRGVQKTASELLRLIKEIKVGFNAASRLLQNLTTAVGRPMRLGSASVLVSARLGRELRAAGLPVGDARWQRRNRADFVVTHDVDADTEGSVAMETGCGKPGKKVVMQDASFTNDSNSIVHRKVALFFSQYRWGLLSEQPVGSPIETGPDGELRVSACSAELRVRLAAADGSSTCEFDVNSRRTSRGCAPKLSESQPDGPLASFMFAPFHRAVNRFCDARSKEPQLQHNGMVDSLMNRQCDGLSAAEVLRNHRDFWGTPDGTRPAPGDISFDVVAEKSNRRVVVVMDTSGSMSGLRIAMMISAVNQFLLEIIEDGSECALISFTNRHSVLSNFVSIQSRRDRERLSSLVSRLHANGGTCIGGAVSAAASVIHKAVNMLGYHGPASASATGQIILLSDGVEGCPGRLNSMVSFLAHSSLEVVSIRYGDKADSRMDRLAEVTGGQKFFGGTSIADSSGLRLALGATTTAIDESKRTLTLTSEEIGSRFVRRRFNVDESVRRDLVFRVTVPSNTGAVTQLRLLLNAPSGREFGYRNRSDIYEANAAIGTVAIRVPDSQIQKGIWILRDEASESQPESHPSTGAGGSIVVTGRSSEDSVEAPVVLTAEVHPSIVQRISEETKIAVFAQLLRGHTPVRGGRLYASVRSDSNLVASFDLMDNGAGADLKAGDGTYSAYLPVAELNEPRDFSVSVKSLSPVSRVTSAGKVTVRYRNPSFNRQLVPPPKVIDFRVTVNTLNNSAVLMWTAVEDPTVKNASAKYEIRYSSSREQLIKNFSTCPILTVLSEGLGAPGSTVQLNAFHQLAGRGAVFVAVSGVSALNVSGPQSNLIGVDLTPPSVTQLTHIGLLPVGDGMGATEPPSRMSVPGLIVGVTASVAAAAGLAYLSMVLHRRASSAQPASLTKPADTDTKQGKAPRSQSANNVSRRNRADFVVTHDVDADTEGSVAMETGCGKPGKKVVMQDASFTNDSNSIVHRKVALFFSQYRWGLLSEQPVGSPIETGPDGELRGNRLTMMKSAVSQFLMEILEDGSECALISFTNGHQLLSGFTKIRSREDRENLSRLVEALNASGSTCIAGAVRAAA
uniref:VWFA domain-containing protein n=1 Tax=Macrostomum lignano TaxID=282301 RepID=A0A1I8GJS2_9PLAT